MKSEDEIFTVRSIENRHHSEPHVCKVVGAHERIGAPAMLIVTLDPPLPGYAYGESRDLSELYLSPRHAGVTLCPEITDWPCHVHMCIRDDSTGEFRVLDWGVLERNLSAK